MKKITTSIMLIISTLSTFAQNSLLISPTGTEVIKFNSALGEKITLFDNAVNSKYGIGIQAGQFRQYVATTSDDFVFGVGSNSVFAERLRIKGNGQLVIPQKNVGGYGGLLIQGNVPGSNYPNIAFSVKNAANNDVVAAMIQGDLTNAATGNESIDLNFLTSTTGLGGLSSKMLIKANGNIGIGTSNPLVKLHVESTSQNPMTIGGADQLWISFRENGIQRGYFGSYYGNAEDVDFGTVDLNTTGKVHFTTNQTIRMTIQDDASGGNIVIAGKIVNEAQQAPTFLNSWVNYGAGYEGAKFYKDKENRVHLSGGVANPNPVSGSVIFTLPVGYRPTAHLTFHVDTFAGSSARVTIFSNGEVMFSSSNANNQYQYVSLSGISFRLD